MPTKQTIVVLLACISSAIGQIVSIDSLPIVGNIPFPKNDCKGKVFEADCTLLDTLRDVHVPGTCQYLGVISHLEEDHSIADPADQDCVFLLIAWSASLRAQCGAARLQRQGCRRRMRSPWRGLEVIARLLRPGRGFSIPGGMSEAEVWTVTMD
jgi:hypothetical protein